MCMRCDGLLIVVGGNGLTVAAFCWLLRSAMCQQEAHDGRQMPQGRQE